MQHIIANPFTRIVYLLLAACLLIPNAPAAALPSRAANSPNWISTDPAGDLWVETPRYRWNVTGGARIDLPGGQPGWEIAGGERALDALLLAQGPETELTHRILWQTAEAAGVYIEWTTDQHRAGLELTFLADGGPVQVTHRQAASTLAAAQPAVRAALRPAEGSPQEYRGQLDAPAGALRPAPVAYIAQVNPISGAGIARLQRLEPAPELRPATISACVSLYNEESCAAQVALPGVAVGRETLVFFTASSADPLEAVRAEAARLQIALPDLDAAFIARTPRYDYDAAKNQPAPGDAVVFSARIANRGGAASGAFAYRWEVDGTLVSSGTHPGLTTAQTADVSYSWAWQEGPHVVSFILDPTNSVSEVSENNNRLDDRTDAISVGFWVEQSTYDYFNLHQVDLGLGSTSWEDYAQRQVRTWNEIFAASVNPLTPAGVVERVRLDKVIVVSDGSLPNPYPSNFPDTSDKSVDLMWGFPSEGVGVISTHAPYGYGPYYLDVPAAQNVDYALLHELSHARYLDDLYTINVSVDYTTLVNAIGAGDTAFTISGAAGSGPFSVPAYLAINQELVICQTGSGSTFSNCTRGGEGTTPRAHAAGSVVNRAGVRAQDGLGNLVMGSLAMPLLGWDDHVYMGRYDDDMMNGGKIYRQHSAYALNKILGRRALCGNYNAPCNLGVYQSDAPQHNVLIVANGKTALAGAVVDVFRARQFPFIYNGEVFLKDPDLTYVSDANGQVDLGAFPFNSEGGGATSYNRALLLRVTVGAAVTYHFFEVTRVNEAFWAGDTGTAYYYLQATTPNADLWVRPRPANGAPGLSATASLSWGNHGAAAVAAPTLTATFDAQLAVASTFPPGADIQPGQVTWSLPEVSEGQVGEVRLVLNMPDGAGQTAYAVNWQISGGAEAHPGDNQGSTQIVMDAARLYLPVAQNAAVSGKDTTLRAISQANDAEIGNLNCTAWATCRSALSGNFSLGGYPEATVEANFDSAIGRYSIKRVFLFFDTSALPDQAVITSAKVRVYSGPWQAGSTRLHVVKSTATTPPGSTSFGRITFTSGGAVVAGPALWVEISLNAGALGWLDKAGLTRLALIHDADLSGIAPTGINNLGVSLSENASRPPELIITYIVP